MPLPWANIEVFFLEGKRKITLSFPFSLFFRLTRFVWESEEIPNFMCWMDGLERWRLGIHEDLQSINQSAFYYYYYHCHYYHYCSGNNGANCVCCLCLKGNDRRQTHLAHYSGFLSSGFPIVCFQQRRMCVSLAFHIRLGFSITVCVEISYVQTH